MSGLADRRRPAAERPLILCGGCRTHDWWGTPTLLWGVEHEGQAFCEATLRKMQDHQKAWCGSRDLRESQAQAAARVEAPGISGNARSGLFHAGLCIEPMR